jgi:hypothetical protein
MFLVFVVVLMAPVAGIVCAGTITETFDSDLGNFDTAVNNRSGGNNWGWSNTSNAGGSAGELGGREKRTGDDYVCDATLGGSLSENDAIIMRGKGWLRDDNADGVFFIGYRTPGGGGGTLGIVLEEPKDYTSGRFRMTLEAGGAESDTYWPVPDDTSFEFDLSYDPVTEVFSGTINGQFATTADNGTVGSFSVDAFGVFDTSGDSRSQYFDFAFDDLEYTLPAVSVGFETASSSALESVSTVDVNVILSAAQSNQVAVDYTVGGGSATNGADYILTPGTLTFEPCDVNEIISIEIINDGNDEEDETIVIILSNPNGVELSIAQYTYTIIDPRPDVQFTTAFSGGVEESLPATIPVSLSHPWNEIVTVEYSVVGGTATGGGVDYNLPAGTLQFDPCQVLKYINIEIVEDACDEGSETIELILSDPNNAKLDDPCQHTYTIRDVYFPSFADSHTVGLWLFDEPDYPHTTLTDASEYEKADLCLMDGGSMVGGKYGNALSVSGSDYAVCYAGFAGKVPEEELREEDGTPSGLWGPTEGSEALLNGLAGDTWTIELWLNLVSGGSGISIIDMGQEYSPGLSLTLNGSSFELVNYYAGVQATCPTGLSTGAWHHVAFTRDGSTVRHFYDGLEQAVPAVSSVAVEPIPDLQIPSDREHESRGFENMDFEQRRQNRFNFAIGSDRHAGNSASGMIDEMRISDVVRYSGNFTPESFSRNYGSGAPGPSVANGPLLLFDPGPVSIPLEIGGRKHVFIDDAIIDTMSSVQITMNQPYGKQAISKDFSIAKSAWRPSVYDVDGVVYMAIPEGYSSNTGTTYLATSPDGLDFTMQGEIITETPLYGSFFRDLNPNIAAEEQYKVNAFVANRGMYMFISPDGLNWRRNETIQLPLRSGGEGECFWDDQGGRYASYIKRDSSFDDPECADQPGRVAVGFWSDEILKAWPFYHMVTPYFEGYPFPAVTCEGPVEFGVTAATQVYRTRAIKYPWAPDVYLAFVWRYPDDDNPRHVDLGISRDGENWSFFGTNWYIPLGSEEEELSMYGLIRRGDEIWQYVDEGGAHGGSAPRYYYRYRQRLDGFVSLDAGGSTGTATTLPMVIEGDKLVLNIAATGSAKVAITNQAGQEISGFGLTDCDLIQGDFVEHVVTWNGDSDVSALAGTVVRLGFEMQNTKLYAFQFRYLGDIDGSGVVDWADVKALSEQWLNDCAGPSWCVGRDINRDNKVNFGDYSILASQWLEGSP